MLIQAQTLNIPTLFHRAPFWKKKHNIIMEMNEHKAQETGTSVLDAACFVGYDAVVSNYSYKIATNTFLLILHCT